MIPPFEFLGREYSAYMICALIGILVAGAVAVTRFKDPYERNNYIDVLLVSGVGVLVGGCLLFGLTNIGLIIQRIKENAGIVAILECFSGSVFYGGMIGGTFTGWLFSKIKKYPTNKYLDATALFIPLFHVFGRIGCFLTGCCFGIECDAGFVYHYSPIPYANEVSRLPIQLIEAFFVLCLFFVLLALYNKRVMEHRLIYVYFISYAVIRFCTEFFRGDDYRGFLLGLSTSQIISILLFVFAAVKLVRTRRKANE